ncbi:uroporphyrinogen-III synthase [Rhodobacteraceae bacterium WD3A24]|nr:uroporphyrinogen-III synthase [Rhodobacteraceae bacterium WD3A24]
MPPTTAAVLLTRPKAQAEDFADQLRAALGPREVVIAPVIEIVPRPATALPAGIGGLIFTSVNGVAGFAAMGGRRGLPAWCVGEATARAARAAGCDAIAAGGDAEALLQLLVQSRPEGPLVHVRGAHAAGRLTERLVAAGIDARALVAYDQNSRALDSAAHALLAREAPVLLPLFSPRSARLVAAEVAQTPLRARLLVCALSQAVARAWRDMRPADAPEIAARPDAAAMIAAMRRALAAADAA